MPGGRPSKYSEELANRICSDIVMGKSLRKICAQDYAPSVVTVFSWLDKYPEFLNQYARAKEEQADAFAEDMLDIADDGSNDYVEDGNGGYDFKGEHVQRSKLRVDTRKWLMSKFKPKKYGDSIDVKSDGAALQPAISVYLPVKDES